jgi:hypothetical protein
MPTKKQNFQNAREQFIKDVISIVDEKEYFKDESLITKRSRADESFKLIGWYYDIIILKYPSEHQNQLPLIEVRVCRRSFNTSRYIKDEYDERVWIYLKVPQYTSQKNNKHNYFIDKYCFNGYNRTIFNRNYCILCDKHTRSKKHEQCKSHKNSICNVVKSIKLPLPMEVQNLIMGYL